ncbi:MAG: phytanoyl-CoA dioxygenase [Silicimonas sp.]|nr:phytanoyl-CoA dioxygenase [Silicimonas sp.]
MSRSPHEEFEQNGRIWLRAAVPKNELSMLADVFDAQKRPGRRIATEDLFEGSQWLARLNAIWPDHRPVRAVAFDKTGTNNWSLPWHQDRVIALAEKHAVPGYSNWTRKAGVWHAEPPLEVLKRMVFTRIHIDANTAENGAMEIATGSHHAGLVPTENALRVVDQCKTEVLEAQAGDIVALSMLTIHRSRTTTSPGSRRVLRVDLSDVALPAPLAWAS